MNTGLDFLRDTYGAAEGEIAIRDGHCHVGATPLLPGRARCDHPHVFDLIRLFDPSWSRLEEKIKVPGPGWERFPKRMEVNVTITGDEGMLTCDCFGPNVYHNGAPNDRYAVQYTYFDEWIGLVDEFVACIREHKTPMINFAWRKQTIQAMLGCYASIQSGKIARI